MRIVARATIARMLRRPAARRRLVARACLLRAVPAAGDGARAPTWPRRARSTTSGSSTRRSTAAIAARAHRRRPPMPAAIVLARAHLERYRERADPADLSAAREALGAVRAAGLDAARSARVAAGARPVAVSRGRLRRRRGDLRERPRRAPAADRGAARRDARMVGKRRRAAGRRRCRASRARAAFARLADRMSAELAQDPGSAAASYWNVVALRGAGEPTRAWDAAVAGWVARAADGRPRRQPCAPISIASCSRASSPTACVTCRRISAPPPSRSSRRSGNWSRRSGNSKLQVTSHQSPRLRVETGLGL